MKKTKKQAKRADPSSVDQVGVSRGKTQTQVEVGNLAPDGRSLEEVIESERKAIADYQNLIRRTQSERDNLVRMAAREFVESLLTPLEHLSLAAEQLDDEGMNLVIAQLWQSLENQGLEEVCPLGEQFDVETMEAVETAGKGQTVKKVVKRGFKLNGEVIAHAKVVVG